MSADCAIATPKGPCGITAIGRCRTCGRAFCLTHQARDESSYGTTSYVDRCSPCRIAETTAEKNAAQVTLRREQGIKAESLRIIAAMTRTGLPGSRTRRLVQWAPATLFRSTRMVYEPIEPVYILGRLRCHRHDDENDWYEEVEIGLTPSGRFTIQTESEVWDPVYSSELGEPLSGKCAPAWKPEEMLSLLHAAARKLGVAL